MIAIAASAIFHPRRLRRAAGVGTLEGAASAIDQNASPTEKCRRTWRDCSP